MNLLLYTNPQCLVATMGPPRRSYPLHHDPTHHPLGHPQTLPLRRLVRPRRLDLADRRRGPPFRQHPILLLDFQYDHVATKCCQERITPSSRKQGGIHEICLPVCTLPNRVNKLLLDSLMGRQVEHVEFLPQVDEGYGKLHEMVVGRGYYMCVVVLGLFFE